MARQTGANTFAGNLEVLAGAPLDARTVVPTKQDLTDSATFPYSYVGMFVAVKDEGKLYLLTAEDFTDENNWKEVGSGSSEDINLDDYLKTEDFETAIEDYAKKEDLDSLATKDELTDYATKSDLDDYTTKEELGAELESYPTKTDLQNAIDGIEIGGSDDPVDLSRFAEKTDLEAYATKEELQDAIDNIDTSGGGSSSLGKDITSVVSVGGISSGDEFKTGTNYDDMWDALLNPTLYPTFRSPSATLGVTPVTKVFETGTTPNVSFNTIFDRGAIIPASGASTPRAGVATSYSLNGGTPQSEKAFMVTVTPATLSYTVTVTYEAGEQPKDSKGNDYQSPLPAGSLNTNTVTFEFADALWSNAANNSTVVKESVISKSTKQKEWKFAAQTATSPEIFDVPASWTVTSVEVLNDLSGKYENCAREFTVTDTTHNNAAGQSVAYKRYTDNRGYAAGARTIKIKWN